MPVAGEVVERNEALEGKPTLVNLNCYADGWMLPAIGPTGNRPPDGRRLNYRQPGWKG